MASFFNNLFDSFTNQQATPQQTIIPTADLLNQSYGTATGLAPQVQALNNAYQPIITGNQLASENQVFGNAANQVQRGAYQSVLDNLNLGNSVSPELQDLITTNTLQGNARSGITGSGAGNLFGARSLLSAGLDLGAQRRAEAMQAAQYLPSSRYTPNTLGIPDVNNIGQDIRGVQAAKDEYANIVEDTRRKNFSSLINTGGRILGTVVGGVAGYFTGNVAGGAIAGGEIGGRVGGKTGVAGYQNYGGGGEQQGGGGGGGGFSSILNGLFSGQGRFSGGAGQQYQDASGALKTSSLATPIATPY